VGWISVSKFTLYEQNYAKIKKTLAAAGSFSVLLQGDGWSTQTLPRPGSLVCTSALNTAMVDILLLAY
jgi:hypothetical protein